MKISLSAIKLCRYITKRFTRSVHSNYIYNMQLHDWMTVFPMLMCGSLLAYETQQVGDWKPSVAAVCLLLVESDQWYRCTTMKTGTQQTNRINTQHHPTHTLTCTTMPGLSMTLAQWTIAHTGVVSFLHTDDNRIPITVSKYAQEVVIQRDMKLQFTFTDKSN